MNRHTRMSGERPIHLRVGAEYRLYEALKSLVLACRRRSGVCALCEAPRNEYHADSCPVNDAIIALYPESEEGVRLSARQAEQCPEWWGIGVESHAPVWRCRHPARHDGYHEAGEGLQSVRWATS